MPSLATLANSSFLSTLALESLFRNKNRLSQSYVEPLNCVVLFADLADFSRLGAQLVADSERGAEELRDIINGVFEQASNGVSARGGHVLYYAGDAILAAWPLGEDSPVETQSAAAIACGLDLQKALTVSPHPAHKLLIRTVVGEGEILLSHIAGDATRPRIVFTGEVLHTVTSAPKQTDDRGILILPQLLAKITPKLLGQLTQHTDDAGTIVTAINSQAIVSHTPATMKDMDGLADYIPAALRDSDLKTSGQWLAEFRSANVLFALFPWRSLAANEDLTKATGFTNAIIAEVKRNGGEIIQFCQDDKGLVLLAGWGLVTSTYENGPERAIRAAQGIAEQAAARDHSHSVAVTTGKVFVGLVGGRSLYQYVMVGDPVNRAAAIAVHSVASVVIDQETRQLVKRRFASTHIDDLAIKGRALSVPVYRPEREMLIDAQHAGLLVGRKAEKEQLDRVIARIEVGEAVDVHLFGDAGLGKSRLAKWYEERLSARGLQSLRMSADALRQTIGYTPWKQIIAPLLGLNWDAPPDRCLAVVSDFFEDDAAARAVLPLLGPVLPSPLADTEFTATLVGAGRAESTRMIILKLLTRLLERCTDSQGKPVVLLVEDAHWLDSASWQMLELAARHIPNLSLALISRPLELDNLPSESRRMFTEGSAETIFLQPLARQDSAELISQALDVVETAEDATDLIYREAAGHPLFTTSLAQTLLKRGLIDCQGGYAHFKLGVAGLRQLSFPDDVEMTIRERIGSLSTSQQMMLKVASVVGRDFDLETLSALYPVPQMAGALAEELDDIAQTKLIDVVDIETRRYRFHHAIIEDTAYRLLLTEQRKTLHMAAGLRIERLVAERDGAQTQSELALLAHHFEHAGDQNRTIAYLARAAENARTEYSNREVVDFLTRALAQADAAGMGHIDKVTRGEWQFRIADALRALGQYQRAEIFLKECATLLGTPPPETAWQVTRALIVEYTKFRIRPHQPPKPENERQPIITASAANALLSEIHYELNKIPYTLAELLHGGNLARFAGGDSATLSRIYISLSLTSTMLPWALNGDELQEQSLAIADRLGDPALISWVYMVSGTYETGKGGWKAGDAHLNHSREVGERCGERKSWETAMSCLGNLKRLEGRFEEAKGWSDLTMAASRDRGVVHGVIWSHNGRARDLLCLSRMEELADETQALERLLRDPAKKQEANNNNNLVYLYSSVFCALKNGEDKRAISFFEELMGVLRSIKRPQVYMIQNVDFYSDIIWNLAKRGYQTDALLDDQRLITKSGQQVAKQFVTGRPMAELALGDGAWFRGKTQVASKHWRTSVESALSLKMYYNAAHALHRLKQTGIATPDENLRLASLLDELKIVRPEIWSL